MLCGTLSFDAGVSTPSGRLVGTDVFVARRSDDATIPRELLDQAWAYLTQHSGARAHAVRYRAATACHQRCSQTLQSGFHRSSTRRSAKARNGSSMHVVISGRSAAVSGVA